MKGEAQTRESGRLDELRGSVRKRRRGRGWLETEGSEGQMRESGRPARRTEPEFMLPAEGPKSRAEQESERP